MGIGDSLKNRSINLLKEKKEEIKDNQMIVNLFDYTGIKEEDIVELELLEAKALNKKNNIVKDILDLGKILTDARNRLASYDKTEGKFINWYSHLNFNANEVSLAINKYNYYLVYPEKKNEIVDLPVRTVRALSNKKLKDDEELKKEVIEKVLDRELVKSTDVKDYIILHSAKSSDEEKQKIIERKEKKQNAQAYINKSFENTTTAVVEKEELKNKIHEILGERLENDEYERLAELLKKEYFLYRKDI